MTRFNVHTQDLVTGVVRRLGARTYSGLKIQTLSWQYRPIAQKDGYRPGSSFTVRLHDPFGSGNRGGLCNQAQSRENLVGHKG